MTDKDRKEYMKKYRAEHRDEFHAKAKKWNAEHNDKHKASTRKWRAEHREEHREYQRKYRAEHREERREYMSKRLSEHREEYRARKKKYYADHIARLRKRMYEDLNTNGVTKYYIRKRSRYILERCHAKLPGYEIHHCFGYDDPSKFIYIPKELHLKIHKFLRDNNIPSHIDHFNAIRELISSYPGYTYIHS